MTHEHDINLHLFIFSLYYYNNIVWFSAGSFTYLLNFSLVILCFWRLLQMGFCLFWFSNRSWSVYKNTFSLVYRLFILWPCFCFCKSFRTFYVYNMSSFNKGKFNSFPIWMHFVSLSYFIALRLLVECWIEMLRPNILAFFLNHWRKALGLSSLSMISIFIELRKFSLILHLL